MSVATKNPFAILDDGQSSLSPRLPQSHPDPSCPSSPSVHRRVGVMSFPHLAHQLPASQPRILGRPAPLPQRLPQLPLLPPPAAHPNQEARPLAAAATTSGVASLPRTRSPPTLPPKMLPPRARRGVSSLLPDPSPLPTHLAHLAFPFPHSRAARSNFYRWLTRIQSTVKAVAVEGDADAVTAATAATAAATAAAGDAPFGSAVIAGAPRAARAPASVSAPPPLPPQSAPRAAGTPR